MKNYTRRKILQLLRQAQQPKGISVNHLMVCPCQKITSFIDNFRVDISFLDRRVRHLRLALSRRQITYFMGHGGSNDLLRSRITVFARSVATRQSSAKTGDKVARKTP